MDKLNEIIGIITGEYKTLGLILIGLVVLFFCIELYYWLGRYGKIPKYRNRQRSNPNPADGISIVVILGDDFHYLENTVPKIMGQEYSDFELVIIEVGSSHEFSDELKMLKTRYSNLTSARLDPDPRFRVSDKMIYNIGIKTARYNNILLTTSDTYPISSKWLDCMAKGFANGEVVIGYCGIEKAKGFGNRMMRCSRLMLSIRYLSSAIAGRPYRGILQNIGFTKQRYLDARGFNYLDMTVGEDDLFIQKIATKESTSIVMNPNATTRQVTWGGISAWWRQRRIRGITNRFYPYWAKRAVSMELWVRLFFITSIILCAIWLPMFTTLGAVGLWIIRAFIIRHQSKRICNRLGERSLGWWMIFYDLIEPFISMTISFSQRIMPAKEVWK